MPTKPVSDTALTALVTALAGAFFAATALPSIHWHDTAEFAAVGWRLSISHPPGHPIHALLTHGAQHALPLGDLALRANLLSAALVALALGALYPLVRALAPGLPRSAAAAAALMPAAVPGVWLQAARSEVYALQFLLTIVIAHLCHRVARGDDDRALPALALAFGLAGANHSFVGLFMLPLAIWAIMVGARRLRPIALAIPAGLLGLLAYACLPLRARAGGLVGWGTPDTLDALWATISGRDWMGNVRPAESDHGATMIGWLIDQIGPIGFLTLLALIALGALPLVRARRAVALAAALAAALPLAAQGLLQVDVNNPDMAGYLAAVPAALIVLAALATDALPAHARRYAALAFPAVLLASLPRLDPDDRIGSRSAEAVARARLAEVPPDGVLVASDYATAFQTWALRALWGERPDVAPIFRARIDAPWQRDRLATEHPAAAAALPDFPTAFTGPEVRYEIGVEMRRLGPLAARLRPAGLTLTVDGDWSTLPALTAAFAPFDAAPDLDGRRAAALAHAQHAEHGLRLTAPDAFIRWHLDRADALAPRDAWLAELRDALDRRNLLDPARPR